MSFAEFIHDCDIDENINITHAIVASGDSVLAKYVKYPYRMDSLKLFFSMTKTFSSLAIGIAGDLGLLNIDDCIVKYFEDKLPQKPDKNLNKITIRHLLMMASGIHENTYEELFVQKDWIKAFLSQTFEHEPGTYYRYSTHGSHMLSAIITRVSGLSLEDFLNKYLFYPMDIYEASWEQSPEGLTAGGMGLSLYPISLVKIAQMLLNKGMYQDKRMISKQYLDLATTQQIIKQDEIENSANCFSGTGYGFQFHIGKDDCYRLDGAFGQLCLLCPDKNRAVIVFSQKSKMEVLLSLVHKYLLHDTQISGDITAQTRESEPPLAKQISIPCGKYILNQNSLGIEALEIISEPEEYKLILKSKDFSNTIKFSINHDTNGQMLFIKDLQEHLQEYVCITTYAQSLTLQIHLIETPYVITYTIHFNNNNINLDFKINTSFTLKNGSASGTRP